MVTMATTKEVEDKPKKERSDFLSQCRDALAKTYAEMLADEAEYDDMASFLAVLEKKVWEVVEVKMKRSYYNGKASAKTDA